VVSDNQIKRKFSARYLAKEEARQLMLITKIFVEALLFEGKNQRENHCDL
jgi:hypothetical protein